MNAPLHSVASEADVPVTTFEDFLRDEHVRLYRALCLVTGSRQEAEDVMQIAFAVDSFVNDWSCRGVDTAFRLDSRAVLRWIASL